MLSAGCFDELSSLNSSDLPDRRTYVPAIALTVATRPVIDKAIAAVPRDRQTEDTAVVEPPLGVDYIYPGGNGIFTYVTLSNL